MIFGVTTAILALTGTLLSPVPARAVAMQAQALPVAALPVTALPARDRTFQDWIAVCDNGNRCEAIGASKEIDALAWSGLGLIRDAGPGGEPQIYVSRSDTPAGEPLTLTVDGQAFTASIPFPGRDDYRLIAPGDRDAVLAALANARQIVTTAQGTPQGQPQGRPQAVTRSRGLRAALAWIDDIQGRTGTVTALVDRGAAAASSVPPAPDLPVLATPPPADRSTPTVPSLYAGTRVPPAFSETIAYRECIKTFDPSSSGLERVDDHLAPGVELWSVHCGDSTMHAIGVFYLTGPGGADPQVLTLPMTGQTMMVNYDTDYDPATRTLHMVYRDPGQCGQEAWWVWTGQTFDLQKELAFSGCWYREPDDRPSTWRTR
ncbi:DUF1176 domain-containing protein [soil metagenome]